ncbi:MAG: polyamine aminopropyltransferase [Betaproteobacteria bacterium]
MRLDEKLNAASGVYFEGTLLESLQTPFQLIEVFDTPELGRLMRIAGANMTSERDEFFYHENLVHPAAIAHPAPRRVLIVGGGDGGSAEEILKHPSVEHVVIAELDAGVIDIARKYFHAVHRGALDDPRVEIRIGDGMKYVGECAEGKTKHDLIYLDLTDPVGPAEALYTEGFYADCKNALNAGGALVLHIGSPFAHAQRVKADVQALRGVFAHVTPYFVHVPMYGATWGFAVASEVLRLGTCDTALVDARLAARQIANRQYYNGSTHQALLAQPEYIREILAGS